jgi:hypothetical protein
MARKILCLDFDGVLHSYTTPWRDSAYIPDPPVEGAIDFLVAALERFDVCIFSSRSKDKTGIDAMRYWLVKHASTWCQQNGLDLAKVDELVTKVQFPMEKPPAFLSIDDRAITFTGAWPALSELEAFDPWNKKEGNNGTSQRRSRPEATRGPGPGLNVVVLRPGGAEAGEQPV